MSDNQHHRIRLPLYAFAALAWPAWSVSARTLDFAGHRWIVRPDGIAPPRDNRWCSRNAFVDDAGALHLKLTHRYGRWCSASVTSADRMAFGTYAWQIKGRVDQLDPNIVLGLFHYPTPDVGRDGTNEIDIEFTKWGKPDAPNLNYSVYPDREGLASTSFRRAISLTGDQNLHRYTWTPTSLLFLSADGAGPVAEWRYAPPHPDQHIAQQPMPVQLNLWTIAPPSDERDVEIVITTFDYQPLGATPPESSGRIGSVSP